MLSMFLRNKKYVNFIHCAHNNNMNIFNALRDLSVPETNWLYFKSVETVNLVTTFIVSNAIKASISKEKTKIN